MELSDCAKDLFIEATQASKMSLYWLVYRHNNQTSIVIEPGAPHHLRGLFSSITPHVAAAVIPPSAMSTKTSSGVPRVIILATLVAAPCNRISREPSRCH
jgi:hypothetical protein